jgi:hypothetical protein
MKPGRKFKKPRPIATHSFRISLPDGFVIIVEYWLNQGTLTKFAAILIRFLEDSEDTEEICRYDTAHDFAHLDVLDDRRKVIDKVKLPHGSFQKALAYAIHDLKTRHLEHWNRFEKTKADRSG